MRQPPPCCHADPMNTTSGAQSPSASPARAPDAAGHQPPATAARPHRTPWLGIGIIAAAALGIEMAVSARYGYHRDELYFQQAGQHPALGYVDQPALTPLAAAACGEYLAAAHLFSTTTFDFFFWAVTLYLVLRLMMSADPRWWVAVGACVGVGMNAKWAVGVLAAALLAGFAL